MFWPWNSITIFEGKIAQLCALVKSTIFIVGISNFRIVYFKCYIFILRGKNFPFIGTLRVSFIFHLGIFEDDFIEERRQGLEAFVNRYEQVYNS